MQKHQIFSVNELRVDNKLDTVSDEKCYKLNF